MHAHSLYLLRFYSEADMIGASLMGLTSHDVLAITGDTGLAEAVGGARAAFLTAGIDPDQQTSDWAILIDASRSTADEHGLDRKTLQPVPGATDLMSLAALRVFALAAANDPDGVARGVFFGSTAYAAAELITLSDYAGWMTRNRTKVGGNTNLSAAMELLIEQIADERECPELKGLLKLDKDATTPAISIKPYNAVIIAEGDPHNPDRVEEILRATKYASIRWTICYVSNQRVGVEVYKDIAGGYGHVHLADFPRGLKGLTDNDAYGQLLEGYAEWYGALTAE